MTAMCIWSSHQIQTFDFFSLFLVWFLCLNGLCIKTIGFTSGLFKKSLIIKTTTTIIRENNIFNCVYSSAARYLLYPGNNILLCFGIYLTVAIAVERWYFDVRYFSKGFFPRGNFPRVFSQMVNSQICHFPSSNFPSLSLPRHSAPACASRGARPLVHPSRRARPQLQPGAPQRANITFGKLPLGKLHTWEVAFKENALGKVPNTFLK